MIIANAMAVPADQIFALPVNEVGTGLAWLATTCYTLQIYFDFSGYSDMAIGLGRMFGFRFPENFRYPYISSTISEFWQRWHISLSSWFRDYLYIPLGGNRGSRLKTYRNLLVVFLLCGFWHGANWTFIAWGLYHGLLLIIERIGLKQWLERCPAPVRHGYLLLAVMIGWVLFRADTLAQALHFLMAMAGFPAELAHTRPIAHYFNHEVAILMVAGIIAWHPILPWAWRRFLALQRSVRPRNRLPLFSIEVLVRLAWLCLLLAGNLLLVAGSSHNPFIYYRF